MTEEVWIGGRHARDVYHKDPDDDEELCKRLNQSDNGRKVDKSNFPGYRPCPFCHDDIERDTDTDTFGNGVHVLLEKHDSIDDIKEELNS